MATTTKYDLTATPVLVSDGSKDAFITINGETVGNDAWFFSTVNSKTAFHTVRQNPGGNGWASVSVTAGFPIYAWCSAGAPVSIVVSVAT